MLVVTLSSVLVVDSVRVQPNHVGEGIPDAAIRLREKMSNQMSDLSEHEEWNSAVFENPAGCAKLARTEYDLTKTQGTFAKEDFEEMLFAYNFTNRGGAPRACLDANRDQKWCPEPGDSQMDNLADGGLREYLLRELATADKSMPLVVAVFQGQVRKTAIGTQLANFLCGWERLNLLDTRSAIFATDYGIAQQLRQLSPKARVLYHPGMDDSMEVLMSTTNLQRKNRIWKLGVAQLLLNLGWDVILTDMDVYWVRDPTPVFVAAAAQEGLEFAAMRSLCWLELNSGFLYYRNTPSTKEMLRMALTTWRESAGCKDNDQYLLNCGFARAAIQGLRYRILPPTDFAWARSSPNVGGASRCNSEQQQDESARWLGDGLPYIWHTGGFSTDYYAQLDVFAAFGLIDINATTGTCKAGTRGTAAEAERVVALSRRACSTREDGFSHANCVGKCQETSWRAQEVVEGFARMMEEHGFSG